MNPITFDTNMMTFPMNKEDEKSTNSLDKLSGFVIGIGALCVLIVLTVYSVNFHTYDISKVPSEWGAFGDFLGGVLNPILSFLSLILVLVTIRQQKTSLQQTSKQIKMSFDEMTKSVMAQEKQADLAEKQLQNLLVKNDVDDLIKILKEVLNDIDNNLSEEVVCFSNVGNRRKLKHQILDIVNRAGNDGAITEFEKYHKGKMKNLKSSFLYCQELLSKLKKSDSSGVMYQYYINKVVLLEESSGVGKYKV